MLSTERLIIRPFQKNDYRDLHDYLSLKEIYQFERGEPISIKKAKQFASEWSKGKNFWAVTLKDDSKKLIGQISFFPTKPDSFKTWEIGFIFNPAYQNKGYATEGTRALINYAFTKLDAHRIIAHCSPENFPSWKVLEKCGMKKEGLAKQDFYLRDDDKGQPIWLDSYAYAILAEDYL
jgi:ribosomal-protein-alanine N-acetyltransferase